MSRICIVDVLPSLLGTYGDAGNRAALEYRSRARGHDVDVVVVQPGDAVPALGDIYLLGGGEDRAQILAASLLRDDGGLADGLARGAAVLGICAGLQLLGEWFTDEDGSRVEGLGLLDARSSRLPQRAVGNAWLEPSANGLVSAVVGFENHRGGSERGPGVPALGRVVTGVGNGDGSDGVLTAGLVGSYLHGPLLALNPEVVDLLLARVLGPLTPLADDAVAAARTARLALVRKEGLSSGQRWRARFRP